jgi:hypothetical protein
MMRMTRRLLTPTAIRQIERLAQDIAHRSSDAVLDRLSDQVGEMSSHEARGYVRSRATAVIYREAAATVSRRQSLPRWAHRELIRQSTDHVVPLVIRDLSSRRSTPTVTRRAG